MSQALQPTNRHIRIAVSIYFFLTGFCFATWASRIPSIQERLRINNAELGAILFALPVGLLISLPVSGWLVAKFGSKKTLLFPAIFYPLILPCLGLVTKPFELAGVLVLFGFAGNMMNISMNTQAVGAEKLYGRSIMASFHGLWSLGGFSGALLAVWMVSMKLLPSLHFAYAAACIIVTALLTYKYALPQDDGEHSNQPIFVLPDKFLLKLGIIAFCCMICEGTMFDWSGVYFVREVKAPQNFTTLGYVAFMSTMSGGRFAGDWLADRFGKKTMIQLSGIVILTGLLIAILFPKIIPATAGFLLVGFGVSSVVPLVYGIAGKSAHMSPGMALAAVSTIGYFGFLLGPPVIGFIAELSNLRWSFAVIAFLGVCTSFLAYFSNIENRRRKA